MVSQDYNCRPREAKRSLETKEFMNSGFQKRDYDTLKKFEHYEKVRDSLHGLVTHFMSDSSPSARMLSRHGYLESSDIPNRYILSNKAKNLIRDPEEED